jgi:hypothetical protein
MGYEQEDEDEELSLSSITKLPLLTILNPPSIMNSPERSGMLTPPLHAAATIPFRWEDEPGKPKPCTALVHFTDLNNGGDFAPKSLELPPRLLIEANLSKLPSPSTVLDGPFVSKSSRFQSLSFRMVGGSGWSFRENPCLSPERGKEKKLFGSWKRIRSPLMGNHGNKGEIGRSYVFPDRESTVDDDGYFSEVYVKKKKNSTRIKRVGSFSVLSDSKSHFWENIYHGLKHVIVPWRGRKQKKDGFIIIN